jgi:hypothetical protein
MGEGSPVRGWGYIDRRGEGRHRTPVRGGGTLCRRPGPGEDGWPMGVYRSSGRVCLAKHRLQCGFLCP